MVEDLNLEKAKPLVRQRRAVHEYQLNFRGQIKPERHLDTVQGYPSSKGKPPATVKSAGKSTAQAQHHPQHAVVPRADNSQCALDVG